MKIKCWGARGSIAVSGNEYLKYGGDTTCIEIRSKNDELIIIDAGTGIRRLGNELVNEPRRVFNILFTHAHWDHLLGFPFFKPIFIGGTTVRVFGCSFAQQSIKDLLSKSMSPPFFPVQLEDIGSHFTFEGACERSFTIDSIEITPILLSHPNQGIGYKFVEDGKSFVFLTDNELMFQHPGGLRFPDYVEFSYGADLLIHDAEFTPEEYAGTRGWGHSSFPDAIRLSSEAKVKKLGLFHHNPGRDDEAIDDMVRDCCLLRDRWHSDIDISAVGEGTEITL
jgi:phosphoribosyl 1,2-cyclic phosphodiesterase